MYSAKDRKHFIAGVTTVKDIIEVLKSYDPEAEFYVCAAHEFFIHKRYDGGAISLDMSGLESVYIVQGDYQDLPEVKAELEDPFESI